MNTRIVGIGLVTVLGLTFLAAWLSREPVGAQEKPAPSLQKWEYKIVLPDSIEDPRANQAQFDKLGAEGWELCAMHSGTPRPNYCVFKRPKR
jgi:hypothetical protein